MVLYDPQGTLVKVAALVFAAGVLWALLAAGLILLGSTRIQPSIPRREVWARWRERRILWGASLIFTVTATLLTADAVCRQVALPDLYWQPRAREILLIAWTGAAAGYLSVLLVFVLIGLRRRPRAGGSAPQRPAPPRRN